MQPEIVVQLTKPESYLKVGEWPSANGVSVRKSWCPK